MPPHRAVIVLGSNIAPERHLPAAAAALARLGRLVAVSGVWQSPAVGDEQQADFCNAAIDLRTTLSADELLGPDGALRRIEVELGRVRDPTNRNAARTIDLDLALFDDIDGVVCGKRLPDPDLFTRSFIAGPLAELPAARLPGRPATALRELAARLTETQPLRPRPDIRLPGAA